ncbi:MAG: amino acid adenylation domain-containing protein, partial [Bacteroidales bacterium]|nr:amino acid adenylation domain-containing protein [Bacteroidales bacterium]
MPPQKVIYDFLKESNNTSSDYPREKCIHEVYEAFAEECPEAIALTFNDFSLTYRELNCRANKLAHYLKSLGVVRETIVGLCIDRSVEAIVSILGILKVGGVYLPLDPKYPLDRLKFMLRDTKAPFLLTRAGLENKFSDIKIKKICFESIEKALWEQPKENLCSGAISENIAYIMYTSGSTGQPKGIEITHRNVLRLIINTNYVNLDKDEILLQYASISFDASTFEIWGALLNGGQLVVCPPGNLLPEVLGQIIKNNNVTTVWLTAALFHNIVENSIESLSSVRQLLAGGDVLFPESVKKVLRELKGICLINGYGPTENTTFTCCYPMTDISQVGSSVPIGRPVSNTKVYILDKNLDLVSVGSMGELYTAGDGVARGYHNRPELTESVFIKNPFSEDPDSRLYKTGDLVKYLPDGNIEFIGRRDDQVKLRGYRIELGEIEQVLLQHDAISQVVSIIREDRQHDKRLVAYYIPKKKIADFSKKLRDFLSAKLPDYMIPQHFVEMDLFPITQNGKIDRKALPEPSIINDTCEHDFQGPETELEGIITGIWKDVLNLDRVDIRDNFFEIGGHSLSAVNVVSRIAKSLNVNLTIGSFFKAPTIRRLAESLKDHPQLAIGKKDKTFQPEIKPFSRNKNLPLSFTQSRLWFIKQLSPESIEYNLPFAMRFQGVIDIDLLKKCLIRIIDRHESLRTTFQLEKDIPVQIINEISDFDIPLIDFSHFSENLRDEQLKAYMEDQAKQSFNFFESPILRASIIRVSKNDHVLFFLTHHILFDGISYEIFKSELFYLYESCKKGQAPLLPEMPVQYADYAVWQQEWLHGKEYKNQSAYWMEQLKGTLPVLEIHADYQRPAIMSFRGAREELIVQDKMVNSLSKTGRSKDATLFMVLFAAFDALLYRYTNQMDICVGVPVAARTSTQIKDLIGFFTNTLVFRTKLKPDFSFLELLEEVKNTTLDALSNQDMPFDRLVEKLNPKRDLSTTPLYQVMFVFLPEIDRDLKLQGLSWKPEKVITHTAQTDLSIWIDKLDDGMNIAIEYNTDLFRASTVRQMLANFEVLLKGIVDEPGLSIAKLPVISGPEKEKMAKWNMTDIDYPKNTCLHQLFEVQAKKTPDKIAALFNNQQITYKELDEKANKLANYFIEFNVGPDIFVGICIDRSLEMLIGLLGILKAGAAYLPMDPEYPDERLAYMMENALVSVLITQDSLLENLPDHKAHIICIDTDWDKISVKSHDKPVLKQEPLPENLAYIIFTSGSTGNPKGV